MNECNVSVQAMLRLSKLADYATVLLVHLGQHEGLATAAALAGETGVPEPTVAKLLKGLASSGLVISHRGPVAVTGWQVRWKKLRSPRLSPLLMVRFRLQPAATVGSANIAPVWPFGAMGHGE